MLVILPSRPLLLVQLLTLPRDLREEPGRLQSHNSPFQRSREGLLAHQVGDAGLVGVYVRATPRQTPADVDPSPARVVRNQPHQSVLVALLLAADAGADGHGRNVDHPTTSPRYTFVSRCSRRASPR